MNIPLDKERKATVYDPEGTPHLVSRLDAVEYLASGHYTLEPPKVEPKAVAPAVVDTTLHVQKK